MKFATSLNRTLGMLSFVGVLASATTAYAGPYIVGGASGAIVNQSSAWAWDGVFLGGFRAALENPANFGPAGIVNRDIDLVNLATVSPATLAGVNMFIAPWILDGQAAPMSAAVVSFFLNGGDLFLLQDDSSHDAIGDALGIATSGSTGAVSNGGVPLFNGPFGVATNVTQHFNVGQLDATAIALHNGHVGGTNGSGQVTSAFWAAGEYAPGAGALFIIADVDMISTTTPAQVAACGVPICGATYSPLNANGIYALNTFSFLQENGGSSVPEPGTCILFGLGLAAVARRVVRSRKSAA